MTWDNYASVIDEVLTMNEKTLAAARKKMVRTVWEQEPSFKDSQLDIALYLSATKTNHDLEAALRLMQSYDPSMFSAMLDLSTASAKQTVHDELKYQAENSQDIADVRALKNSLAQISISCPVSASTPTVLPLLLTVPTPQRTVPPSWPMAPRPCMTA